MADERLDYAVLISLSTREEAEVAAASLRAEGVDAMLGNAYAGAAVGVLTQAMGGMQVMVPASQLVEAKELLRSRLNDWSGADEDDDSTPAKRNDRWKAWMLLAMIFGPMLVFIMPLVIERWAGLFARMFGH